MKRIYKSPKLLIYQIERKKYDRPRIQILYSYDMDTELMYGNTFSGGGHASGLPLIGSNQKAPDEPEPTLELGDEWDIDDSDR